MPRSRGLPTTRRGGTRRPAARPIPRLAFLLACSCVSAVALTMSASGSASELREAGARYAAGDARPAVAILSKVIDRGGKTAWEAEALYLRAMILETDMRDPQAALRDLRSLSVLFAGTEAAPFGQFGIARIYEKDGLVSDAYREYVLCSRLRGIPEGGRSALGDASGSPHVTRRITSNGATRLLELAAERAAGIFGRLPIAGAPGDVGLPPRTFVATGPRCSFDIPADPRGRPASGRRSGVWHIVAPAGKSIAGVAARFEAVVDPEAAGPDSAKSYGMRVEPLPPGPVAPLTIHGTKTRPEERLGRLLLPGGAGSARVTITRSGARVIRCAMDVDVRDSAPAEPGPPPPPRGFVFAVPPGAEGARDAGGADLARAGGKVFLAWHSSGRGAFPAPPGRADLYISSCTPGGEWAAPVRLPVSSATDDRGPSLGSLPGGGLLLAWTSDRAGAGRSDIYVAESPDGAAWSRPARLEIDPRELDSMPHRIVSRGKVVASAALTFHRPEVSIDSKGVARLFFVAHGTRYAKTGNRGVAELAATGVYGVVSTGANRWSKPVAIVSTPATHLDRFRPAPKTREREVVSPGASPAVIEREPGRSLVGWTSTCGRVFLTQRGQGGKWTHHDTRFAGAAPAEAASDIEILGPVDDAYGVLLLRSDRTPKLVWRDKKGRKPWRVEDVDAAVPPGTFAEVAAVELAGGRSWLTAWTGPAGPGGICVREIRAPAARPPKRRP